LKEKDHEGLEAIKARLVDSAGELTGEDLDEKIKEHIEHEEMKKRKDHRA